MNDELEEALGQSLTFISDPERSLIDEIGMRNGDVTYRGYAIVSSDEQGVLKQVNDY